MLRILLPILSFVLLGGAVITLQADDLTMICVKAVKDN